MEQGGEAVVNYEEWALDMCSLLDRIEMVANDLATIIPEVEEISALAQGRFSLAEKHGFRVVLMEWTESRPESSIIFLFEPYRFRQRFL